MKHRGVPRWMSVFLKDIYQLGSPSILEELHMLSREKQSALQRYAISVLRNNQMKRDAKLRSGAVRLIVSLLARTFRVLEDLLADCSSSLWYEIQFTTFAALDRNDLSEADQERILVSIERYLLNAKSTAGFAAWKAGDMLGDEWNSPETVQILERLLFRAKHVAGRESALHGITHAIIEASPPEKRRLFTLISKVASEDRSNEVRRSAKRALEGGGCHRLSAQEASSL